MSLDVGLLIAGAKERGELEARVTTLIREILNEGGSILNYILKESGFVVAQT